MSPWSSGSFEVPGGHIAYHRTGGALPPLVLSHGLTDNGLCWTRTAAALEGDFDLIMLDARGHGMSSPLAEGEVETPGADIAAAVRALGLTRPVLMGHSLGARSTAACAAAHPGLASRVILEDPPLMPLADPDAVSRRRVRFREQVATFRSMSEAELTAMGRKNSPLWHEDEFPAWSQSKRQVDPSAAPDFRIEWREMIAGIAEPTLLIHGEGALGGIVTEEIAAEARALNPNITSVLIRGAGHNVRRENFTDYMTAVRSFLGVG